MKTDHSALNHTLSEGEEVFSPSATLDDLPAGLSVTVDGFSRLVGTSPSTVYGRLRAGSLRASGRNRLPVAENVRLYCDLIGTKGSERQRAGSKDRLASAQAEWHELRVQKARGELLDATAVEREWQSILRGVRAELLSLPSRIGSRVGLTPTDVAAIDREVRDLLESLAEGRGFDAPTVDDDDPAERRRRAIEELV